MRVRIAVGASVLALSFFGFLPGASADPIRGTSSARPSLFDDVFSAQSGRDHAEAIRADQGWLRMGEDLDRLYRQMMGNRNRETAKPFRGEQGRQPVASAPAPSTPAPAPSQPASSFVPALPPAAQPLPPTGLLEAPPFQPVGLLALGPQDLATGPQDLALAPIGPAAQSIPTPEPASLVLLGSGLAGAAILRLRRRKIRVATPEL